MKHLLFILIVANLITLRALPQVKKVGQIKGLIKDKNTQLPLPDVSVTVMSMTDSSRVAMRYTNKIGEFLLMEIPPGSYNLFVSHLGYQTSWKTMTITGEKATDFGIIYLEKIGLMLTEVEIEGKRLPIVIKKDTVEFNASNFKTRENAVLEELLKMLPGVLIEKDGTIKVYGETVKTVLVNGTSFFGNNPKMATRTLTADMIEKIQLIDRKSDQAQFNGINDGKSEKAVNLIIKGSKKNRLSGHIAAGYGTDDRFSADATLSQFSTDQHVTILGRGDNVNGYQDGVGHNTADNQNGIVKRILGGVNYGSNLGPKLKVTGSYFANNVDTRTEHNSGRQNLLKDSTYYYNQNIISLNNNISHHLGVKAEFRIDTMHTLIAATNISYSTNRNFRESSYESLDTKQQTINSGVLHNRSTSKTPYTTFNILIGKRFKKAGRTLSMDLGTISNKNNQVNFNLSHNLFMQQNGETYADTIDQRNDFSSKNQQLSVRIIYTEPLLKYKFIDLMYAYSRDQTLLSKSTFDYNPSKKKYDALNDTLSNVFENISSLQTASISMRTQNEKFDYSWGINVLFGILNNNNVSANKSGRRNTVNFFPSASFNYTFAQSHRLNFNYTGTIRQPSSVQLQPVPDNSNPLYIQLGNPGLKPASIHSFKLGYDAFNTVTMRAFNFNVNAGIVRNKVITASWFDSSGKQVSQPMNMSGPYNIDVNMVNTIPLKKQNFSVNCNTQFIFNHDITSINGIKGGINSFNITQGFGLGYAYKELFDFNTGAMVSYNKIKYSLQKDNNVNFFNYDFSFDWNVNLPLGFRIGGLLDYMLNTGRTSGYNLDITMLNMFISKSLLKHKKGLIKLQGFDLLKQNTSITRNIGQNYIEDLRTKVLQQYFMVSFSYFLKPAPKAKK